MALANVANLVRGLSRDPGAVKALRNEPERLATRQGLSKSATAALVGVDRFFRTEKPILQAPQPKIQTVAVAAPAAVARQDLAASGPLTASSDTGSLLPGPNTGTFTASGSGSASLTGIAPSPGHPAPGPGPKVSPAPAIGPSPSIAPTTPHPPFPAPGPASGPVSPIGPALPIPAGPVMPFAPGVIWPQAGPDCPRAPINGADNPLAAFLAQAAGGGCSRDAAVVAINALVAATAQTSLTAIAAIAAQRANRRGS